VFPSAGGDVSGHRQSILVVGARDLDSGKTTVALALLQALRRRGRSCCGFKPKAGNNLWYDFDVVSKSLHQGRLFGHDAQLLRQYSCVPLIEEQVNPVHRLHPIPSTGQPAASASFVLDRVSTWNNGHLQTAVVNKMFEARCEALPLVDRFLSRCDRVIYVEDTRQLADLASTLYEQAIASAHRMLKARCDAIVCESFSDVAVPWGGMESPDTVLVVAPGEVREYDPDRYFQAASMLSGMLNETSTGRILEVLEPLRTIRIPPLTSDRRVERLQRQLSEIVY